MDGPLLNILTRLYPIFENLLCISFQESMQADRTAPRKKSSLATTKSWSIDVEQLDPTKEPEMRFLSQTHDTKVRQTLEHLEKKQEEIFEL